MVGDGHTHIVIVFMIIYVSHKGLVISFAQYFVHTVMLNTEKNAVSSEKQC